MKAQFDLALLILFWSLAASLSLWFCFLSLTISFTSAEKGICERGPSEWMEAEKAGEEVQEEAVVLWHHREKRVLMKNYNDEKRRGVE